MPANISEFMSSFTRDLARPNRFEVKIPPVGPNNLLLQNSILRCETAELPGRTFSTIEQKFGSNPLEKYPYHTTYNDISLNFIVSGDMAEKYFFDSWMELVIPTTNFNPKYKEDYICDITIIQYDLQNIATYSVNLIGCYPISVNQLDLDWSSDSHHKLTVVFAYTYWQKTPNRVDDPVAQAFPVNLNNPQGQVDNTFLPIPRPNPNP